MAEQIPQAQFKAALEQVVQPKLTPDQRKPHGEAIGRYVDQLEARAKETVLEIDQLKTKVLSLEEAAKETVPKTKLETAQKKALELEEQIALLKDQLQKASGDKNPVVIELKNQVASLEEARYQAVAKSEELQAEVSRLSKAAEEHPRQIEDITKRADGEAEKVKALQQQMKRYQEVALEVANLPHAQAETQLQEATKELADIQGNTPQDEANKAILTHKIALLEAKQKEHLAIQQKLREASQTVITATEQETASDGDVQSLRGLLALVPRDSQSQSYAYLQNAVKAIANMQQVLFKTYKRSFGHAEIGKMLQDIHGWYQVCLRLLNNTVAACQANLGDNENEKRANIARYVEQLERKKAEMERLINLPQGEIQGELDQGREAFNEAQGEYERMDAVSDEEKNKDAIAKALYEVQFHELRVQVLTGIQAQHHQPLIDAHVAEVTSLELKNRLRVALQGITGGLLRMLVSIPSTLIGGLQTMGNPIVKKPDSR